MNRSPQNNEKNNNRRGSKVLIGDRSFDRPQHKPTKDLSPIGQLLSRPSKSPRKGGFPRDDGSRDKKKEENGRRKKSQTGGNRDLLDQIDNLLKRT